MPGPSIGYADARARRTIAASSLHHGNLIGSRKRDYRYTRSDFCFAITIVTMPVKKLLFYRICGFAIVSRRNFVVSLLGDADICGSANNIRIRIAERAVPLFRWLRVSQIPSSRNRVNQRYAVWCGGNAPAACARNSHRAAQRRSRSLPRASASTDGGQFRQAAAATARVFATRLVNLGSAGRPGHALPGSCSARALGVHIEGSRDCGRCRFPGFSGFQDPPAGVSRRTLITYNQACCCRPPAHCRIRVSDKMQRGHAAPRRLHNVDLHPFRCYAVL